MKPLSFIPRLPHLIDLAVTAPNSTYYGTGGIFLGSAKLAGTSLLLIGPYGEPLVGANDVTGDKFDLIGLEKWPGGRNAYIGTFAKADDGYRVYGTEGRYLGSVAVADEGTRTYHNAFGRLIGVGVPGDERCDFSDSRGTYVGTVHFRAPG